jgi:hypothetical protein
MTVVACALEWMVAMLIAIEAKRNDCARKLIAESEICPSQQIAGKVI